MAHQMVEHADLRSCAAARRASASPAERAAGSWGAAAARWCGLAGQRWCKPAGERSPAAAAQLLAWPAAGWRQPHLAGLCHPGSAECPLPGPAALFCAEIGRHCLACRTIVCGSCCAAGSMAAASVQMLTCNSETKHCKVARCWATCFLPQTEVCWAASSIFKCCCK